MPTGIEEGLLTQQAPEGRQKLSLFYADGVSINSKPEGGGGFGRSGGLLKPNVKAEARRKERRITAFNIFKRLGEVEFRTQPGEGNVEFPSRLSCSYTWHRR